MMRIHSIHRILADAIQCDWRVYINPVLLCLSQFVFQSTVDVFHRVLEESAGPEALLDLFDLVLDSSFIVGLCG